jgi:hypothetical protein
MPVIPNDYNLTQLNELDSENNIYTIRCELIIWNRESIILSQAKS